MFLSLVRMLITASESLMENLLPYLLELRKRMIKALFLIGITFIIFFVYSNQLFYWFTKPLRHISSVQLIAIDVASPLMVPIQLAALLALIITMPYLLYQFWSFVMPALYQKEKRLFRLILFSSIGLFYVGIFFCYFAVLPLVFAFFASTLPPDVHFSPDISRVLTFCFNLIFVFGLCFELPIIILFLLKMGLVDHQQLKKFRPYFVVLAFTVGMLLTPPDVLSQLMLALPICVLYELGVFIGGYFENNGHIKISDN